MDTVQTTTARPHIVWLDVLRLVAILMVIAIHCTDPFNASPESRANPEFNFWGSVYGSMLRASVPLFVMMTWISFVAGRPGSSTFYKKRIPRVLFPFLIWSVLLIWPLVIQWVGGSPELVTDFFPWEPESFGLVRRGVEDDRFDSSNLYGLCDADVVYLCADRALSVYAGLLRMGGEGVG